jgi:ABC-type Co2+ transport system permease subunit
MGLLGLLVFVVGMLSYVRRVFFQHLGLFTLGAMWFFYVFVMGSVGDPVPWVCLAIGYRWVARFRTEPSSAPIRMAVAS